MRILGDSTVSRRFWKTHATKSIKPSAQLSVAAASCWQRPNTRCFPLSKAFDSAALSLNSKRLNNAIDDRMPQDAVCFIETLGANNAQA